MKSSSRTRRLGDLPRPTLEMHFVWKNTTFRAPAIYQNFTKCCACHEKWHSNFSKYCACHEKWISWLIRVTYETSFTMHGATNVTGQVQQMRIYKKPRPFRHLFVADRILRAWYRGIKNAGSRKRAQGRAQDIPYHHSIYTNIMYVSNWLFVSYPSFLPCTLVTFEIGWSICLQEVSCLFTGDVTCRMENCSFGCVDWS